jgi:Fungal protein kinase
MAGYTLMSDDELGMNIYIKEDKAGKYIMFKGEDKAKEENLYLEDRPIAFQRAIVCRGTTCYRAKRRDSKRWEFVVKFL